LRAQKLFVVLFALVHAWPALAGGEQDAVPRAVRGSGAIPEWIATDGVPLTEEQLAQLSMASVVDAAKAGRFAAASQDTCSVYLSAAETEHYKPNQTLDDLAREAREIITGSITAVREGVFRGRPAMLLRVNSPAAGRYVVYPYATIRIGDAVVCSRPASDFKPRVGDHVLFFSYTKPVAGDGSVYEIDAAREIAFGRGAELYAPQSLVKELRSDAEARFQDMVSVVRDRARHYGKTTIQGENPND
jgi:hypothetical protein